MSIPPLEAVASAVVPPLTELHRFNSGEVALSTIDWVERSERANGLPRWTPSSHPFAELVNAHEPLLIGVENGWPAVVSFRPQAAAIASSSRGSPEPAPASSGWRRVGFPAAMVRDLDRFFASIRDARVSGRLLLDFHPLSPQRRAALVAAATRASVGARTGLQFGVNESVSETERELVPSTTETEQGGLSIIIASLSGSTSRQTFDRGTAVDKGRTKGWSAGLDGELRNPEIEAFLDELKRVLGVERRLFESAIYVDDGLAEVAERFQRHHPMRAVLAPFHCVFDDEVLARATAALDRAVPMRVFRAPRSAPPGGNAPLIIPGAGVRLRIDPGTVVTISGQVGAGKTRLASSLAANAARPESVVIVLDGEKSAAEQTAYSSPEFEIVTPQSLLRDGFRLLGMGHAARKRLREIFTAVIPGGGPVNSIIARAFDPPPSDDGVDSLTARLELAKTLAVADFAARSEEVVAHIRARLECFLLATAVVPQLVTADENRAAIVAPGRRMVICLGDEAEADRAVFVLAFLAALRDSGPASADVFVILDEMSCIFGGAEADRRPESLTEDTSRSLLGRYLDSAVKLARQRSIQIAFVDQCLRGIPDAVRDRAGYHVLFHQVHRKELELFADLCGLPEHQRTVLEREVESTRNTSASGRLCLVGGPRVAQTYAQPYITAKVLEHG